MGRHFSIVIWGNKITSNISHPVGFHASKETARSLLPDTKKWLQNHFEEVDWENLNLAMESSPTCTKCGDPNTTLVFVELGFRSEDIWG
jgi:hypothetical protein